MDGPIRVSVPSQKKIDGHVRYRIEIIRDQTIRGTRHKDVVVNEFCEKRRSEVLALKDRVSSSLGLREYNRLFASTPFPGSWESNTAAKIQLWLETLVNAFNNKHGVLSQPDLCAHLTTFLKLSKTPSSEIEEIERKKNAEIQALEQNAESEVQRASPAEAVAKSHLLALEKAQVEAAANAEKERVMLSPQVQPTRVEPAPSVPRIQAKKTLTRLFARTMAELPYAKMRFTAFGRAQFALHALLYFATAAAIYEQQLQGSEENNSLSSEASTDSGKHGSKTEAWLGGEENSWVPPLACLVLGLVASNACLSEERSPTFFQRLSVVSIWVNLAVAVGTVESRVCGAAPPLALAFPNTLFAPLTNEVLFLLLNVTTVAFVDTDCTLDGLERAAAALVSSPERLVSVAHGLFVALPILVANLSGVAGAPATAAAATMDPGVLLLRHVLLVVLLSNLMAPSESSASFGAMHLMHCFPFLSSIFESGIEGAPPAVYWPFSIPVSVALFVASAAAARFPSVVRGQGLPKGRPPSKAHEVLRSGSLVGAAAFTANAAFFLAALLCRATMANSSGNAATVSASSSFEGSVAGGQPPALSSFDVETLVVDLSLFALGFSNLHAALSSEQSHSAMALFSVCALFGNVGVWSAQLASLVNFPIGELLSSFSLTAVVSGLEPLTRATDAWGLPPFVTFLTMWEVSAMAMLLLKLEVSFRHYEPLVRGTHLAHAGLVLLPTLSTRLGFAGHEPGVGCCFEQGEGAMVLGASEGRWPGVDAGLLALYSLAVGGFFFGGLLDRAFTLAAPAFYSGILAGFFHVSGFSKPAGWTFGLRPSIAVWLLSLFFLRFRHLTEPRVKSA